ncbi:MAG: hypothetical protein MUO19_02210 [Dehalococcoidales bacterium]|nr:hypothetical protein [Dehalococcoidales bacterium]
MVTRSNNARRFSAALFFLTGMAVAALGALMLLAAFPPVPHVTAYASASPAAVIASLPAAALPVILIQETAWTPAPGVTAAMDVTVYVEGDSSLCLTIGKDFTGGLIAAAETTAASEPYRTGELSFWIKADVPAAFGGLEIVAGSDNYNLPAGDLDGAWHQVNITLPADGLRGSVALYATENPGADRIWLDGMEIKASGNAPYYPDTLPKQLVNAFSEEAHYA